MKRMKKIEDMKLNRAAHHLNVNWTITTLFSLPLQGRVI